MFSVHFDGTAQFRVLEVDLDYPVKGWTTVNVHDRDWELALVRVRANGVPWRLLSAKDKTLALSEEYKVRNA